MATILLVASIIFAVLVVLVVAMFVAIKGGSAEEFSIKERMLAYGTAAAAVGIIVLAVWANSRLRFRAVAKQRPGALIIHGTAPAVTLKRPDAPKEELEAANELSSEGASLVATEDAFEIWSNDDLVEPIRTITNTPEVQIWREDRFFNRVSSSQDTRYIYLEATVISDPSGLEIVFRSKDEPASFNSIVAARAKE